MSAERTTRRVMQLGVVALFVVAAVSAFSTSNQRQGISSRIPRAQLKMSSTKSSDVVIPPLRRTKPRKIALFIEPTPFTYVCGYSNRFKELLRFLSKAGDVS